MATIMKMGLANNKAVPATRMSIVLLYKGNFNFLSLELISFFLTSTPDKMDDNEILSGVEVKDTEVDVDNLRVSIIVSFKNLRFSWPFFVTS
jgi:hypothetical protein